MNYFVFTQEHIYDGNILWGEFKTKEEAEDFIMKEMKSSYDFKPELNDFVIVKGERLNLSSKEVIIKIEVEE